VLKDVPGVDALSMEVFGMNTPEYLQRKQEKSVHYDVEYGHRLPARHFGAQGRE